MSFENTDTTIPTGDAATTLAHTGTQDTTSPVSSVENDKLVDLLQKRVDDKEVFVEQMKLENADMRNQLRSLEEKLEKSRTVDELIGRVKDTEELRTQTVPSTNDVTEAVLMEIKRKNNMQNVEQAMEQNYGEKYAEVVRGKAQEMGLSFSQLDEMCYNSPAAAIKLFGGDKPQSVAPTTSNASAHSVASSDNSGQADMAYYNNLRKTNAREYWKPEVQKAYRQLILQNKQENS